METKIELSKKAKVLGCIGNINKSVDIARLCNCSEAYVHQIKKTLYGIYT